jgi:hypothetical protein
MHEALQRLPAPHRSLKLISSTLPLMTRFDGCDQN